MRISAAISLLSFVLVAVAHPGSHNGHDVLTRRKFLADAKRSISDCAYKIKASGTEGRAVSRRAALADTLRSRRGLPGRRTLSKRDLTSTLTTEHKSNRTDLTSASQGPDVFTGDLACVLQPEVTIGPYCT